MAEGFNIYCDESCHLEHDGISVMVLGALWCKTDATRQVSERIREIKQRHGVPPVAEVKWSKVSPAKQQMFLDLIDYFFDDDDLHFRGVLIPDKSQLDHAAFHQSHDTWYYKMCFRMLEPIIDPAQCYRIYLDIKDTRSEQKREKLEQVLRSSRSDPHGEFIKRVQQIRSHESELMQLADLIIGAICHHNRGLQSSAAKTAVIERIQKRSKKSLKSTTWLRESKLNIFVWQGRG